MYALSSCLTSDGASLWVTVLLVLCTLIVLLLSEYAMCSHYLSVQSEKNEHFIDFLKFHELLVFLALNDICPLIESTRFRRPDGPVTMMQHSSNALSVPGILCPIAN